MSLRFSCSQNAYDCCYAQSGYKKNATFLLLTASSLLHVLSHKKNILDIPLDYQTKKPEAKSSGSMIINNIFYNSLILIFRNHTGSPWSCNAIFPFLNLAKPGISLNLLPATILFQASSHMVVETTLVPFK